MRRLIGRTPPSPCSGSTMIAAVEAVTAARERGRIVGRHERHVREAAARTARGSARPTSPTATPIVRPWNECSNATKPGARRALRVPVAARELQARLDGLGAAVAEERARQAGERSTSRAASSPCSGWKYRFDVCSSSRACAAIASARRGCAWPSARDADAGEQVEIAAARPRRTAGSPARARTPPGRGGRPAAGARSRSAITSVAVVMSISSFAFPRSHSMPDPTAPLGLEDSTSPVACVSSSAGCRRPVTVPASPIAPRRSRPRGRRRRARARQAVSLATMPECASPDAIIASMPSSVSCRDQSGPRCRARRRSRRR